MVHLNAEVIGLLDAKAKRRGVSRSQLIREAVDALLAPDRHEQLADRYRQGYSDAPPDSEDAWGELGAWHDELARVRAAERSGSAPPWQ